MLFRNVSIPAVILFIVSVLVWSFTYGPAKRSFVIPDKTITLKSAHELDNLWHTSGVHGRVAVLFSRHLNQPFSFNAFPEIDYLDNAMNHGLVRTAYYIVPDSMWTDAVTKNIENPALIIPPKMIDSGYFIVLHEGGRIHVVRFSKFIPEHEREKSLVVIEPALWTQQELARIDGFIKSRQLTSDLTVIINTAETAKN